MSSISSPSLCYSVKTTEICVSKFSHYSNRKTILKYFEQFGTPTSYYFTSDTNGHLFLTYETISMANACMKARPHYLDGKHLYVKRSLPVDDAHPRERFEDTTNLMIVIDFDHQIWTDPQFLIKLRDYFSSYGQVLDCQRCHETNFDYVRVRFADEDSVDQVILDKPHHYYDHLLNVMKHIRSNVKMMNEKYASSKQQSVSVGKNSINDDSIRSPNRSFKSNSTMREPINELSLQSELYQLQNDLKSMHEDFALQRKQLEEECSDELKQINENVSRSRSLQQDLENEHVKLLAEYELLKQENDLLNEQYLSVEFENFEITSYYEPLLAEETAKTIQLEAELAQRQKASNADPSPPPSSPKKEYPTQAVELTNS